VEHSERMETNGLQPELQGAKAANPAPMNTTEVGSSLLDASRKRIIRNQPLGRKYSGQGGPASYEVRTEMIVRPKPFGGTKKLTAVSPPICSFQSRPLPVRLRLPCNRLESQKALDLAPRA